MILKMAAHSHRKFVETQMELDLYACIFAMSRPITMLFAWMDRFGSAARLDSITLTRACRDASFSRDIFGDQKILHSICGAWSIVQRDPFAQ